MANEWGLIQIRLEMEFLISEREGMIAENKQREHRGEPMAYTYDNFMTLADKLYGLIALVRNLD